MTTDPETPGLPRLIRDEIAKRGISQREAAETLGVTQQTVSRWAKGKLVPSTESIPRLARFLHLSTAELRQLRADVSPSTSIDRLEERMGELEQLVITLARKVDQVLPKSGRSGR